MYKSYLSFSFFNPPFPTCILELAKNSENVFGWIDEKLDE